LSDAHGLRGRRRSEVVAGRSAGVTSLYSHHPSSLTPTELACSVSSSIFPLVLPVPLPVICPSLASLLCSTQSDSSRRYWLLLSIELTLRLNLHCCYFLWNHSFPFFAHNFCHPLHNNIMGSLWCHYDVIMTFFIPLPLRHCCSVFVFLLCFSLF
jgi:hypothetical protein